MIDRDAHPPQVAAKDRLKPADHAQGLRSVIGIAGAASNTGKTWLCERLVSTLRKRDLPVTAIKVTRTHVATCPRENDGCGVCDSLRQPFEIIEDEDRLFRPGKDTGRYRAAGAETVLWLLVQPMHLAEGIASLFSKIPAGSLVVAEGNSFVEAVEADHVAMMLSGDELKPSAENLIERVHAFGARKRDQARAHEMLTKRNAPKVPLLLPDSLVTWLDALL